MTPNTATPYDRIKRVFDLLLAVVAVVLLAIPMLIVAVAILVSSPGPIIYRARRLGRNQVPFFQWKFRTMQHNAPDLRNPDGSTLSSKDDPRVTKVGRFLRQLSLDELPQFFNVIAGTMSLVGPRPDPVNCADLYRPRDFERLSVLPGITGWAIIHGRNNIPWERRRDLDLEYVSQRSLRLDFYILVKTVGLVLDRRGVHTPSESA